MELDTYIYTYMFLFLPSAASRTSYIRQQCTSLPPAAVFQGRQPRGCQDRTIRLRKALGEMFHTPTFLAPALCIMPTNCGDIGQGKSTQGCVVYTGVYGIPGEGDADAPVATAI